MCEWRGLCPFSTLQGPGINCELFCLCSSYTRVRITHCHKSSLKGIICDQHERAVLLSLWLAFQISCIFIVHCWDEFWREEKERCLWDVKLSKETCSSSGINEQESDIFLAGNLTTFSSVSLSILRGGRSQAQPRLPLVQRPVSGADQVSGSQPSGLAASKPRLPGP